MLQPIERIERAAHLCRDAGVEDGVSLSQVARALVDR
jgi:hypothetical protein